MKAIKTLLIFAVITAVTVSCSKTETHQGGQQDERVAVRFATELATRASGDTWAAGDVIGVRMLDASDATVAGYENKQYVTEESGATATFRATGEDMYYPMDGSRVGFAAFYPSAVLRNDSEFPVDVSIQSYPEEIDLMWAKTAVNYSKTSPNVALQFEHKLSRLVIGTTADASVGQSLTGMDVTISGLNTTARFDILSGSFSTVADVADITPYTTLDGEIYDAIVIPGSIAAGTVEVAFTIHPGTANAETFTWEVPATTFEPGKGHPWAITLTRTGVEAIQGTITDWGLGQGGTGVAE